MMIRLFLLGEDFAAEQGALVQDADGGDVDQGLADPQVVGGQQPGWWCCWSVCWVTQSDPALQHAAPLHELRAGVETQAYHPRGAVDGQKAASQRRRQRI